MAIALVGTGGLYTRWGKTIKAIANMRGAAGAVAPSPASAWGASGPTIIDSAVAFDSIADQYEAAALEDLVGGIYSQQASHRSALAGQFSAFASLAEQTIIRMANNDTPLSALSLDKAMALLLKQMKTSADTVKSNITTVTAAAVGGNIGNPTFTASLIGPDGKLREYAIPEVIHCTASTDRNNGATAGLESFTFSSPVSIGDPMDKLWPGGSAASGSLSMCNNTVDADSSGNMLINSDFEVFTVANLPDNWTKTVGTLGTSILKSTAQEHGDGIASLSFVGDAAELTGIKTAFNVTDATGTTVALTPQTVYAVSIWLRTSGVPVAGVYALQLIDGADAVINDDAGTANTISQSLPAMAGTTWVNVTGYFRTPTNIPATMFLRLSLTTALSIGTTLWMDDLGVCKATEIYTGGPFCAMFDGTTDVLIGDDFTATVTNDYGGAFQTWCERFFGLRTGLKVQLPSATSGGQTIADTLCF